VFSFSGYVRLVTNLGPLNFELHCDMVPKTCENFVTLCKRGYYNGTKFHRSIKHFMVTRFLAFILLILLISNGNRFKGVIQQVVVKAANLVGEMPLRMNSSQIYRILEEAFYQWLIPVPTRTNLSCKHTELRFPKNVIFYCIIYF